MSKSSKGEMWSLVAEDNQFVYYVSDRGNTRRCIWKHSDQANGTPGGILQDSIELIEPYVVNQHAVVLIPPIGEVCLKDLVAEHHRNRHYRLGRDQVFLLDGSDPLCCRVDNLILLTKNEAELLNRSTPKVKVYRVYDRETESVRIYFGQRKLLKALNCSAPTLYSYQKNKNHSSKLSKYEIELLDEVDSKQSKQRKMDKGTVQLITNYLNQNHHTRLRAISLLKSFNMG